MAGYSKFLMWNQIFVPTLCQYGFFQSKDSSLRTHSGMYVYAQGRREQGRRVILYQVSRYNKKLKTFFLTFYKIKSPLGIPGLGVNGLLFSFLMSTHSFSIFWAQKIFFFRIFFWWNYFLLSIQGEIFSVYNISLIRFSSTLTFKISSIGSTIFRPIPLFDYWKSGKFVKNI